MGDPAARNAGLVAAAGVPGGATRRVRRRAQRRARGARAQVAVVGGGAASLDVGAGGVASATLDAPAGDGAVVVRLDDPDGALSSTTR
ncbi:MAG: hypothetical protein U1E39_11470 [Planctomycetota bacterium]